MSPLLFTALIVVVALLVCVLAVIAATTASDHTRPWERL